ncbi:MAG: hypothetical protein QNJ11_19560, partial [Woeseiaceae bacterium]|nr:hypothetical protein [Woeseiaceae bacterium]
MKLGKWFKRTALVLGALAVLYFVVGSFYVSKVSQREEDWHEEAVANTVRATPEEWLDVVHHENPRIELRYRPKPGVLYRVRVYEDRSYVSALFPGSSDVTPIRFETGTIGISEWRALRDLAEEMYPVRETLFQDDDNRNPADARLTIVHENRQRLLYKYHTSSYAQLPQLLRDYDALLFKTMQSWTVKPHHGHARPVPQISYDVEAIPNLVRGLESPREDLHASVVERLVDIGQPALPELIRVLRKGEQARYRPVSRYSAVIDGIGELADVSSEGYTLAKSVAAGTDGAPGQKTLRKQAQEVVDRFEIEAYLAERWTVSPEVEALFAERRLSRDQEIEAMAEFRYRFNLRPERDSASDVLIGVGSDVLPVVLEQLRRERVEKNYINDELLEVLGELGGYEALLFAIKNDVVAASACIEPLRKLGANGIPGMLALLESGERNARHQAAHVLAQPEYRNYTTELGATLESKLRAYR